MSLILDNYELRISSIIKKYTEVFFRNPNIVGFGRGFKSRNGNLTKEPCLIIYVKKKVSICNLDKDKIIPKYFSGALTDVCEGGEIRFRGSEIFSGDRVANINSYEEGWDEKDPHSYDVGTITCALSEIGVQKNIYLLGCNHVLTRGDGEYQGKGKLNDKIVYVGSEYGQVEVIGRLCDIAPINHSYTEKLPPTSVMDAALVYVGPINDENKKKVSPSITKDRKIIQGVSSAKIRDAIHCYGAESGWMKGKVTSVETKCIVKGERGSKIRKAVFENNICVNIKCKDGDSGALALATRANGEFAVGMLIAGAEEYSYFTPLDIILKYFKLNLLRY